MAVPGFQEIMLPLLKLTEDGMEHTLGEAIEQIAQLFHLTDEERSALLPSGGQKQFNNRVGWAKTHLVKAKLLESTLRGYFHIADRGREVLMHQPAQITVRYLLQFSEYQTFKNHTRHTSETPEEIRQEERRAQSPVEILEASYLELRASLADELLERIAQCKPQFFEQLVVDLLLAMGYGGSRKDAGLAIGKSGDDGIDGIIKEDKLGLDVVYVQAKRWQDNVGRPVIQGFAGSLEGHRARKGVFITTSGFTPDAKEYVTRIEKKIVLIDGQQLAQFLIDYGIGVTEVNAYVIKRVDNDYFNED